MKQKKKKLNIQKILFFILFIISAVYCINRYTVNTNINQSLLPNSINNSNYKIIKQDKNKNYSGIGKEKIKIKEHISNINKMVILLGLIRNIGMVLWLKTDVE